MAGVYDAIRIFALEHKDCGELRGNARADHTRGIRGRGVSCSGGA